MHLFGDPNLPKRNLVEGATLLVLSSFQVGTTVERLIWSSYTSRVDYFFLALMIGVLLAGTKIFRRALGSLPPDPRDKRPNEIALQ